MESQKVEQLAIVAEARSAVADRLTTPWWYHPILGLLLAGFVIALSLGSIPVTAIAAVLFIASCGALAGAYRRLTGVWISGLDAGRASRWAMAMGAVVGVASATSWFIGYWTELAWPAWCLAAVVFVSTVLLGRRFDAALRAQLRAGA